MSDHNFAARQGGGGRSGRDWQWPYSSPQVTVPATLGHGHGAPMASWVHGTHPGQSQTNGQWNHVAATPQTSPISSYSTAPQNAQSRPANRTWRENRQNKKKLAETMATGVQQKAAASSAGKGSVPSSSSGHVVPKSSSSGKVILPTSLPSYAPMPASSSKHVMVATASPHCGVVLTSQPPNVVTPTGPQGNFFMPTPSQGNPITPLGDAMKRLYRSLVSCQNLCEGYQHTFDTHAGHLRRMVEEETLDMVWRDLIARNDPKKFQQVMTNVYQRMSDLRAVLEATQLGNHQGWSISERDPGFFERQTRAAANTLSQCDRLADLFARARAERSACNILVEELDQMTVVLDPERRASLYRDSEEEEEEDEEPVKRKAHAKSRQNVNRKATRHGKGSQTGKGSQNDKGTEEKRARQKGKGTRGKDASQKGKKGYEGDGNESDENAGNGDDTLDGEGAFNGEGDLNGDDTQKEEECAGERGAVENGDSQDQTTEVAHEDNDNDAQDGNEGENQEEAGGDGGWA